MLGHHWSTTGLERRAESPGRAATNRYIVASSCPHPPHRRSVPVERRTNAPQRPPFRTRNLSFSAVRLSDGAGSSRRAESWCALSASLRRLPLKAETAAYFATLELRRFHSRHFRPGRRSVLPRRRISDKRPRAATDALDDAMSRQKSIALF